jgi:hypothetical protein
MYLQFASRWGCKTYQLLPSRVGIILSRWYAPGYTRRISARVIEDAPETLLDGAF